MLRTLQNKFHGHTHRSLCLCTHTRQHSTQKLPFSFSKARFASITSRGGSWQLTGLRPPARPWRRQGQDCVLRLRLCPWSWTLTSHLGWLWSAAAVHPSSPTPTSRSLLLTHVTCAKSPLKFFEAAQPRPSVHSVRAAAHISTAGRGFPGESVSAKVTSTGSRVSTEGETLQDQMKTKEKDMCGQRTLCLPTSEPVKKGAELRRGHSSSPTCGGCWPRKAQRPLPLPSFPGRGQGGHHLGSLCHVLYESKWTFSLGQNKKPSAWSPGWGRVRLQAQENETELGHKSMRPG